MSNQAERFDWVAKLARAAMFATLTLLGLAFFGSAAGIVFYAIGGEWILMGASIAGLLAALVTASWVILCYGWVKIGVAIEGDVSAAASRLSRVETLLEDQVVSSKKLIELTALSDQARSLLYRDRELDAFREALQDNLMRQDYNSAESLINTIESRFGNTSEATRMRAEMEASRKGTLDERIGDAVSRIQGIIDAHDWVRALRETQRVLRLFPDNPNVTALPGKIEAGRARHKRDLLEGYGDAVKKNDVDHSIELLKELDRYLTPQEAAAMEESARGVFKAKLHNLGVQFAIHVTDRQWGKAVATGEEIMRAYPNTRMAYEVSQKMDLLRSRAAAEKTG